MEYKDKSSETKSPIIGTASLLGVAFIVLKLCGIIDWSWWYVLIPFYYPIVFLLIILVIATVAVLASNRHG